MKYSIKATSMSEKDATIIVKGTNIVFGTTPTTADRLPNPAELFLSSFAACILKNIERFSHLMNFEYNSADILVSAARLEKPPRIDSIEYSVNIHTKQENINIELLKRNIEKFGTIYNTVRQSSAITGKIACTIVP